MALQKGNEQGCGPRMRKADAVPYLLQANNEIPWFDSQCFRNLISDEVHVKVGYEFCPSESLHYQNLNQVLL